MTDRNGHGGSLSESFRHLQSLVAYPREALNLELKGWLDLTDDEHKASLAKAMLALANSGGGHILLGFVEQDNDYMAAPNRPEDLRCYSQDIINGIVQSYSEPSFHCMVHNVLHPETEEMFPVVVVPGEHSVPIRARRDGPRGRHVRENTYYIRRPGPTSEAPRSAQEWNELLRRCLVAQRGELLDSIRAVLAGRPTSTSQESVEGRSLEEWISRSCDRWQVVVTQRLGNQGSVRFRYGVWTVAYTILGDFERLALPSLLEVLRSVQGVESGWPPWWVPARDPIRPYPYENGIECLIAEPDVGPLSDGAHSDFWSVSSEGHLFLRRGYRDDGHSARQQGIEPGTVLDFVLPIWRVGECLLHGYRLAAALGVESNSVLFSFSWAGLTSRVLSNWASPQRYLSYDRRCRQEVVTSRLLMPANQIAEQLPEVVKEVTNPLYEAFEFFELPLHIVGEILDDMRGRAGR